MGKVKTGRLWFHHYVWGFAVLVSAAFAMLVYSYTNNVSLLTPYTKLTTDAALNSCRFFVLGGFALVLDDFTDISSRLKTVLCSIRQKLSNGHRLLHSLQALFGAITLYVFLSVAIWIAQSLQNLTVANLILAGSLLVTALTSFASASKRMWRQN